MQEPLSMKASEWDYTRGMQCMAQMDEPATNRAQVGQTKDQSMLRGVLKGLGMHAYKLGHKQGNDA